jgi:tetratricopeptide (TPR) repeat protein
MIQFSGAACTGIDPRAVRELNRFLGDFPKTQRRLLELLDKKDVELADKVKEIEEWTTKYRELSKQLEEEPADDEMSSRAVTLLKQGELDKAATLLDEILARDEKRVDRAARNHFNRARAYELQFQPLKALPLYEKAYSYRPQAYAYVYALRLHQQYFHREAEPVYLTALQNARELARDKAGVHLDILAQTLAYLGTLYREMRRMKEAETCFSEALTLRRQLAEQNDIYVPKLVLTLNGLGILYKTTQRLKEAEMMFSENLALSRQLVNKGNNEPHVRASIAGTLNNLGLLYHRTQRMKEAASAYAESLATYRQLGNSGTYLPDVAMVLNNLGDVYRDMHRVKEAEVAFKDAIVTLQEVAREKRSHRYDPYMATALNNLGNVYRDMHLPKEAEIAYKDALAIRREITKDNRTAYLPDVANTLVNLGRLYYYDMQRMSEAETLFNEGLIAYRQLAKESPAAYLSQVAATLNDFGSIYIDTQRMKEAKVAYREALGIYRELIKTAPTVYGDGLARSLRGAARTVAVSKTELSHACALTREALDVAVSISKTNTIAAVHQEVCEASR